ncbi:helix-turn-helix domain-containing protein [Lacticaseibacillus sp. GG6-2]
MLDDLLIQFFDAQARRETSVYLLLIGKKTLSILYAALSHHQLQWLQLYPTLQRADYQAAIARLVAEGALKAGANGLVLADEAAKAAAAQRVPLPEHYRPDLAVHDSVPKFQLAVQVLSEASYHERRYRPVVQDWAVQQAVRRWWQDCDVPSATAALEAAFATLPQASADALAHRLVGHAYVGDARPADLAGWLHGIDELAQLISVIATSPATSAWYRLWGGPKPLGTASAYQVLALITQGRSKAQAAAQLRLKPSTINEHLLTVVIEGADLPLTQFYTVEQRQALSQQDATAGYSALMAAVPDCDFFQVRLYQILRLQGRWPDANA